MKSELYEWRPVVGYEGLYEVSNLGEVRRLERVDSNNRVWPSIILKQCGRVYNQIHVSVNNKIHNLLIHRLVAEAFLPNPDNLPCVNHIDCNTRNNSVDNLEWCDARQNYYHQPTYAKHVNNVYYSKPVIQYTLSGQFVKEWPSQAEAGRVLGKDPSSISDCCRGKRKTAWGYVWKYKLP